MASKRYVVGGSGQHAGFGRTSLASLDDVDITSPVEKDELRYLSSKWKNRAGFWVDPVVSIFDNTTNLPLTPLLGERYIAKVTANGWVADQIYECTDQTGLATWTEVNTGGLAGANVVSMCVNGTDTYAGTNNLGVFRSTNYGALWTPVNTGLTDLSVRSMARNTSYIFAGTASGVFRSNDNGATWTAVNTGLPATKIATALHVIGTRLFVGLYGNGIYMSADNGDTWADRSPPNVLVTCITSNTNYLFAGTRSGGCFRTNTLGVTWGAINTGLELTISSLLTDGSDLYAGGVYGGVHKSTNDGASWVDINTGLPAGDKYVTSLCVSGYTIFAGMYANGCAYTIDGGATWTTLNTGFPLLTAESLWCLIVNPGYVFTGTFAHGVYRNSLTPVWQLTTPVDGMSAYNQDTNTIHCYNGVSWDIIAIDVMVKTSNADPSPGYLVAKLEAGMAMGVTEDTSDPSDYKAKLDVNLGTLSNQAAAGSDGRFGHFYSTLTSQVPAAPLAEVYYGTGNPPSAVGIVDGSLYFKYTP
jgi:hypothetical protein